MKTSIKAYLLLCASLSPFQPILADRWQQSLSGSDWQLWRDKSAFWEKDRLYLPSQIHDLSTLPVNPPTGGWDKLYSNPEATPVSVPGTAEEYLTTSSSPSPNDSKGVTWWWRDISIPSYDKGNRVILDFESVRMRAEVYIDGKLAAYDLIGETPFSADITDYVKPGEKHKLAVRVTNPGGNFHWQDFDRMKWGDYTIQPARGFSGLIGRVGIKCVDLVWISDIYMQNTLKPTDVNLIFKAENDGKPVKRNIEIKVFEKNNPGVAVISKTIKNEIIPTGGKEMSISLSHNGAKLWTPEDPALYTCTVSLKEGKNITDSDRKDFGFRSFTIDGIGKDAVFRLNGERVMMRSAISWGYFPATGLYATPEMARRQINTAKALGLNTLNFHRSIGSPVVLEAADEMGLLYYEEPGAIHSGNHDPFLREILNEKVKRMVKRDRSHPSLVIYNMINEFGGVLAQDKELVAKRLEDMRVAHSYDPSRIMTYTSGWADSKDKEEVAKAHFRPMDTTMYMKGWFDNHRAGGPETYVEEYYKGPDNNIMFTDNREEIFMRGEEGAISTPPRIHKIVEEISKTGKTGWDGLFWEKQYAAFADYFKRKDLASHFGSIDNLTMSMGNVSLNHQGRRIQEMRMQDIGDAYMINGWESMPYDNHSGVVDIYRNPKGDPSILSYYNQPLYVAVAPRNQIVRLPGKVAVDYYIVNEKNLNGNFDLEIILRSPEGKEMHKESKEVSVTGGDIFGELLIDDSPLMLDNTGGIYSIEASVKDRTGKVLAKGRDEVLGVSWSENDIKGKGAFYGLENDNVAAFYKSATGKELPPFNPEEKDLDWIVVNRPSLDEPTPVPDYIFTDSEGKPTLKATWYSDPDLTYAVEEKSASNINASFVEGAQPDPSLSANQPFSILWEGEIIPRSSGQYLIGIETNRGVRLHIDGEQLIDEYHNNDPIAQTRPVVMEKGKPIHIRMLYRQNPQSGYVRLKWSQPNSAAIAPEVLLDKVKNDGTTLILLGSAETWMKPVAEYCGLDYNGYYRVGKDWVGGIHFVKDHPLFSGLPVNRAMDWQYQSVVRDGENRFGFRINGEEMVAGSYKSWPFELGTAVGTVKCGKGKIIFSTLDITGNLLNPSGPSEVARKIFTNFLNY